ncbi:hypothetical protein [Corallococcus silvisoli]|uniref:hypothetical protein n=1 Tax=Corallococcus silvisoli TaxID=2697031 RepID=UPI00137702B7|nr:hypothetical protein [Corallococcus silvisoli]NBD11812.1 hypothetical protein [Corallococcus silvisoli]
MTCPKHKQCPNLPRLMDAYKARGELRAQLEASEAEVRRLRLRLAGVGIHEAESPYTPPPAHVPCGVPTAEGPCPEPAPLGGTCAAHLADEVMP